MKQQTTLVKLLTLLLTFTFAAAYTQLPPRAYCSEPLGNTTRLVLQDKYETVHNGKTYTMWYPQKMQNTRQISPVSKATAQMKTMMTDLMDSHCRNLAWNQEGVCSIGRAHPKNDSARIDSGNTCSGTWRAMEFQIGGKNGTYAKLVFDGDAEIFLGAGFGGALQAYFEEGMQLSANAHDIYHVKVTSCDIQAQSSRQQALAYQQATAAAADAANRTAALNAEHARQLAAAQQAAYYDRLANEQAEQERRAKAAAVKVALEQATAEVALQQAAALVSPRSASSSPRSDGSDLSVNSTVSTNSDISGIALKDDGSLRNKKLMPLVKAGTGGTVKGVDSLNGVEWALINFRSNATGQELLAYVPVTQFCNLNREMF